MMQDQNNRSKEIKKRLAAGETSFEREDLAGIDLAGMHTLEGINFRRCKLADSNFRGCTLRKSDFRGADLARVCFEDTDLEDCLFEGPELGQANCRGAAMEGVVIEKYILD